MKDIEDIYELTPVQEGMLFHSLYAPDRGDYIEQYICTLTGAPDIQALARAWDMVIQQHPVLRTSFHWNGAEKPLQVVHRNVRSCFEQMDWRDITRQARTARLKIFLKNDRVKGFDTTQPPLTRFTVIRETDRTCRFIWTFHHILLDGWCLPLILSEVRRYYQAITKDTPCELIRPLPFREYVLWLQRQDLSLAEAFWKKAFEEGAEPTPLMPTGIRYNRKTPPAGYRDAVLTLGADLSGRLTTLARQSKVTPGVLFLGTWALLLSRYHLHKDILIGMTVSGRPTDLPGAETIIGPLMQTIPAVIRVEDSLNTTDWLRALQTQQAEWMAHAALPLVDIRKMSGIPSSRPLFEIIFAFENYPLPGLAETHDGPDDFSVREIQLRGQTHYPAAVAVVPGQDILIRLSYDTGVYGTQDVHRLLGHWKQLLESLAQNPGQPITKLDLSDHNEKMNILHRWNPAPTPDAEPTCIHRLFETQVERTPVAPAVIFQDRTLTYAALNRRANRLARLLQRKGVGPDTLVGVCLERCPDMVTAVLAVLKAGGGYVPLDPDYPARRLAHMLADSRPVLVICHADTAEKLDSLCPAPLVRLPDDLGPCLLCDVENVESGTGPQHIAYVIYTSGSTGKPKGVAIPHEAIANHMYWMAERFPLTAADHVLQKTPFSFDASIWEFYAPLLAGAALVMARPGVHQDMDELIRTIQDQDISILQMVPSLLRLLLQDGRLSSCPRLRRVFCGGEVLSPVLQEQFFNVSQAELVNLYGPTETCIDATCHVCAPDRPVWIGRPIHNLAAYILDADMQPAPPGIPGELYISGKGLARGYLNQPELTAAAFIPHPFSTEPGQRIYRTGDLARWSDEGDIEFLGRRDRQLKISGYRIEADEIENAIAGHPDVRETVVLSRETVPGQHHLAAYVVFDHPSDGALPASSGTKADLLRAYLKSLLPGYMIPSNFIFPETLPRLPNGKLDCAALPEPPSTDATQDRAIPQDAVEELLAAIWGQVLEQDAIGRHDNFFSLGGNSLLVTRVISRVRQAMGRELPVRLLFDHPTVAEFRKALRSMGDKALAPDPPLVPLPTEEDPPLSFAQARLWFLDQLDGESGVYNLPSGLRIRGALNPNALEQAVNDIIRRHEVLRTTFAVTYGVPVQKVAAHSKNLLQKVDLRAFSRNEQETAVRNRAEEEARKPFDLNQGPLLRIVLMRLSDDKQTGAPDHALLVTMHHIISDGWSMGLFIREFTVLYNAFSRGRPASLADPVIQYKDYAVWQRQWLSGERLEKLLTYWKQRLDRVPAQPALPIDRPRPPRRTGNGRLFRFTIPEDVTAELRALCRQSNTTLFMTLLGAFAVLLFRLSGREDIAVGAPVANRSRPEIEPLIGFFVNTLVHRLDLSGDPNFQELLARVRRIVIEDHDHQALPFERLVEELQPERDLSHNPLFQVMFVLQNAAAGDLEIPDLEVTPLEEAYCTAKFDLTLIARKKNDGLDCAWEYSTDLFEERTLARMTERFVMLLRAIVREPNLHITALPVMTGEDERLLRQWNATEADYPLDRTVMDLFETQAAKTPDHPAVCFQDRRLTYGRLNRMAARVGTALKEIHHLKDEEPVGVMMDRSEYLVIAIFGILKAGGVYVPILPETPPSRRDYILEDSQCRIVLADAQYIPSLAQVEPVDMHDLLRDTSDDIDLPSRATASGPAYIIYTSGSTGRPKGVIIAHQALVNRLCWMQRQYPLDPDNVVLHKTPISFDVSIWELFGWCICGASLAMPPQGDEKIPDRIIRAVARYRVSHIHFVPSMLGIFLEWVKRAKTDLSVLSSLKRVYASGEALHASQAHLFNTLLFSTNGTTLHNLYGPTETTVEVSWYDCSPLETGTKGVVPIGKPIGNTCLYVLDANLQPAPVGVPGELCVAGSGLALGYLNLPEMTAEKFLDIPIFGKTTRIYRTGDRARWLPEGNLEFLGRMDSQVKLRGFRIEPGEIEAVLMGHPLVEKAAVVLVNVDNNPRLAGYVTIDKQGTADPAVLPSELRDYAGSRLPEYMVPADLCIVDGLPLTSSGKIDRKALPAPTTNVGRHAYLAPRNVHELALQQIWENVLKKRPIGVNDDFFKIGGHSLLAVNLVLLIREQFQKNLPVSTVFTAPTIEQMAVVLRTDSPPLKWTPLIALQSSGRHPPLFCVHPAGGGSLFYADLARQLAPDHPVYGLQPRGLDDESRNFHTRVEDMAACYIQAIIARFPQGPYHLAGASFGGLVAFEMARKLIDMGKQVALLALMDTYTPTAMTPDPPEDDAALLAALWEDELSITDNDLRGLTPEQMLDHIIIRAISARLLPPDFSMELIRLILDMTRISVRAAFNYHPGSYNGNMLLFRAENSSRENEDPCLGWENLVQGDLTVQWIKGTHQNILREPQVRPLARHLKQFLKKGA